MSIVSSEADSKREISNSISLELLSSSELYFRTIILYFGRKTNLLDKKILQSPVQKTRVGQEISFPSGRIAI